MKTLLISIIMISLIVIITTMSYSYAQDQDMLASYIALQNRGETSSTVYFLPGEQIEFVGTVMDNTKHTPVSNATVTIALTSPNNTTTKLENITSGSGGEYNTAITITDGFEVGMYAVNVSAHKSGYQNNINDNGAAFFFVARGSKQIIKTEGQDFPVYLESIELQTENLTFNKNTKSLNFNVKKIPGDYAPKGISWINGLPYQNAIFATFKRPLISAPFHIFVNNQEVYAQVEENKTHYFIDVGIPNSDHSIENVSIVGTYVIPEFPFAIPVLLISFVSVIVFYRMKSRK